MVRLHQNSFEKIESRIYMYSCSNSLRRFMRLPWRNSASGMFVNLSIRSFDEMLRIFTFGFMSRVIVSNNVLISNSYNSPCRLYSKMLEFITVTFAGDKISN